MTKYKINKGFIVQKLDDKTTIFDGEESLLYTFNITATFIFQKLKLGWTKEKIIDGLLNKYKIKRERASDDIDELIEELLKKKIITADKSPKLSSK